MAQFLGCVSRSVVMYYGMLIAAHFLLSLSVLRSLLRKASATDNYFQFKLGHSAQCLHAMRSAASTTTAQLNFHHHFAKQQSATKNVDNFFHVLHKYRIPERISVCCTSPFISFTAYSCQKIRTTLLDILSLLFLSGNTLCVYAHTHSSSRCTLIPIHNLTVVSLYVT